MALRDVNMAEDEKDFPDSIGNKQRYSPVSLDENIEREPVFYYSREHRLSRASSRVKDLYDSKYGKMGVAKRLFGNRSNAMLFIMIIITFVMLSFVSRYTQAKTSVKLGGNTVELAIQREDEVPILDITKQSAKTGNAFIGEVEIAVSPVIQNLNEGETPPFFYHRIIFTTAAYENFQITLPFDGNEFILLLKTAYEQKSVKINAK
jgi:hypothetical protein